jgi:hypothetical protein
MRRESLYNITALMGNLPDVCRKRYAAPLPDSLVGSVEFDEGPSNVRTDRAAPTARRRIGA